MKADQQGQPKTKPILVAREWLTVAVLLVVIVFLWIGFGVYGALTTVRLPEPVKEQASPLSVTVDTQVLDELEGRIRFQDEQLIEEERVIFDSDEK